jgi:hypothetical protein
MAVDTDDYADTDPRTELTADGLATELKLMIACGPVDWFVDAAVEALANGDLEFFRRQVERHVDGWRTP